MRAMIFDRSDSAYFSWLASHPLGYVVNARRNLEPSYLMLHAAQCGLISTAKRASGAYTERGYIKVCSTEIDELRHWLRQHGRPDGSFSKQCSCV